MKYKKISDHDAWKGIAHLPCYCMKDHDHQVGQEYGPEEIEELKIHAGMLEHQLAEMRDWCKTLRQRLEKSWLPIYNAPKDGRKILGANEDGILITYWSQTQEAWYAGRDWLDQRAVFWDPLYWTEIPEDPFDKRVVPSDHEDGQP